MQHLAVKDVMTSEVVRVVPETGFREIVNLLTEFDITAVPVVDAEDRPAGVVSEADLIHTQAAQADQRGPSPAPPPSGPPAVTAGQLMTSPAVCITPDESVVAAARLMATRHVKRLPVVDADGRLIGMVSRGDLLRVFLRDDRSIRNEIVEEVLVDVRGVSPAAVGVEVEQGQVVLSGTIEPPELVPLVLRLCRSVDGVVSVTDRTNRTATGGERAPGS
ncbi:CBS domain-containing protein [Streptomyces sp. ISL-11]|uniref:CBS domain-containing protein n=1 Tax=Streptomyces sp. ISL-11 TaxID=2819174 RepID=UPI001BE5CDE8|nr:CBS domain-containing protein [Streptomyces sp. ISL-11]MBT2382976.1 CBS domain-containing protein [Streptomyces sp. ISL-11]